MKFPFFTGITKAFMIAAAMIPCVPGLSQTCTSNPTTITSDINFGSIVWTASGGATEAQCEDMADGLITFTGNVVVDIANNTKITITNDVSIDGNFNLSGGWASVLSVNGGYTLHVTGDLGDADNNGVQYEVVTEDDSIIVDGTLYGKNINAFTGEGTITGGTLDVRNGSSCGSPCPVAGGFDNCVSDDGFCTDYGVLPILLLSFTASKDQEFVTLKWSTIMEENFDKFIIERSSDGLEFSEIGQVPGAGRNIYELITEYTYQDRYPVNGFNYYRLKALDLDFRSDYSKIVAVRLEEPRRFWVQPNPARGTIRYLTNFHPSEGDRIVLLNQLGTPFISAPARSHAGVLHVDGALSPGIYFLTYYSSGAQYSTRVLVE